MKVDRIQSIITWSRQERVPRQDVLNRKIRTGELKKDIIILTEFIDKDEMNKCLRTISNII
jgi:hypothetical protein